MILALFERTLANVKEMLNFWWYVKDVRSRSKFAIKVFKFLFVVIPDCVLLRQSRTGVRNSTAT